MQPDADRIPPQQMTASIPEAARLLGISEEAVRGRIKRGTLESVKVGGRTHALLDADQTRLDDDRTDAGTPRESEFSALTSALEARIESLERQQELLERQLDQANERDRENRRLLAAALERIPPQLEAPQTSEDAPGRPAEPSEGVEPYPEESTPWWRRILR
jgi:excisionase family DNA binding protein